MQDFLLHDNGIKKIYHCKELRVYLVLDENSEVIKVYNMEMRIECRYQPMKERHHGKIVKITYFDFNQFNNKLCVACSDYSLELVNLWNFMNKSKE